ncbi:hypothetical protein [Haladaptatus litoreus]|nr:hypothetical protein [Haladaptatus litoreus]
MATAVEIFWCRIVNINWGDGNSQPTPTNELDSLNSGRDDHPV